MDIPKPELNEGLKEFMFRCADSEYIKTNYPQSNVQERLYICSNIYSGEAIELPK